MERYEFYHNMLKYRNNNKDILEHGIGGNIVKNMTNNLLKKATPGASVPNSTSKRRRNSGGSSTNSDTNYGDYYYKIDNFYKDGSAKYFKTKDEYDTWTKNQAQATGAATTNKTTTNKEKTPQQKAIERQHINEVNNKMNYINNKGYAEIAGAERAKKEKVNAAREALLSRNQAGREAAIKNSKTEVSNLEFAKRVAKDKEYNEKLEKERIKKEMQEQVADAFKKIKEKSKENAKRLADTKDMDVKKTMDKIGKEIKGLKVVSSNPITKSVYTAAKKKENAVNNYIKENKESLNAELPSFKKEKINQLNGNSHDIDKLLRKINSGDELTSSDIKNLKKNPLYNSIITIIDENDDDFNIGNYLKKSKNIDKFKQAYKTVTREVESKIDSMTIEDLAATRV